MPHTRESFFLRGMALAGLQALALPAQVLPDDEAEASADSAWTHPSLDVQHTEPTPSGLPAGATRLVLK